MKYSQSELFAMVQLLDDTDSEVVAIVEEKIIESGKEIITQLEQLWLESKDDSIQFKIEKIIKKIQTKSLKQDVKNWIDSNRQSYIEAWILASRIEYPNLTLSDLKASLNKIKIDAWMLLAEVKNPLDQIRVLNHVFFNLNHFAGNTENYHHPNNSLMPKVLEKKTGNPISLSILYASIAQELGIPLFGVNLPQHFILGYATMKISDENHMLNLSNTELKIEHVESIQFYVNAYSKGQVFNKESIDAFLKVIHVTSDPQFYMPCITLEIFKRMLRNMHFSYSEQHQFDKQREVEDLMRFIGMLDDVDSNEEDA